MKKTLAVLALAGSLGLMGAVPAMADSYPAPKPSATVSDGTVDVGETFVFAGSGFTPGETVTVTVRQGRGNGPIVSTYTVTANSSGAFTLSLSIGKAGAFTLTATGAGGKTASATVNVKKGAANGVALASTGGTSLANTGASPDLILWSLVGAGALAAGTTSVAIVRRRAKIDATA